jgi:hypothetical protein
VIRHVVVLTWKADATPDQVAAVEAGLAELEATVPGIVDYCYGPDAGLGAGNGDFAIVADFASVDDYVVYRDHPAHRAFLEGTLRPAIASRSAVQVAFEPSA